MLKAYKPIQHKIFDAQKLIEHLVFEVWCKADKQRYKTKLNDELKVLIAEKHDWFEDGIKEIYSVCKCFDSDKREALKKAFATNNKIEELCSNPSLRIPLNTLDGKLQELIIPFFKKFYDNFLGWKTIEDKYGSKKTYYDELITANSFKFCPCCGYGQIKTIYDKGHSAFDHYLPLKHYPFSVVNFHNLVPLCTECNSDNKGETDILKKGKKVFYPFNNNHPELIVNVDFDVSFLPKIVKKTDDKNKFNSKQICISFNIVSEEIESWDSIFSIKKRYSNQIANNRINWINDVREIYRDPDINTKTYSDAFDKAIKLDSNKHLGFLKASYLNKMKSFSSLVEALEEVSGHSKINV